MKSIFLVTLFISAIGCSVETPANPAAESSVSTATAAEEEMEELQAGPAAPAAGFCRNEWECDITLPTRWFATQATCEAACGVGNCVNTPHCQLGCVCP